MPAFKAKHVVEDINGTRCSVVETGIDESRLQFLTKVLEHNKYTVIREKTAETYKIGVTDMLFNSVVDVYKRKLRTLDGRVLLHEYWFQLPEKVIVD